MLELVLKGRQRVISSTAAAAGAGAVNLDLKPDDGKIWVVALANGYQISGGARDLTWYFIDPDTSGALAPQASFADYAVIPVYSSSTTVGNRAALPIVCSQTRYLRLVLTATGAGDDVYIRAVVYEFLGTGK